MYVSIHVASDLFPQGCIASEWMAPTLIYTYIHDAFRGLQTSRKMSVVDSFTSKCNGDWGIGERWYVHGSLANEVCVDVCMYRCSALRK